jgi:hypothetical protein
MAGPPALATWSRRWLGFKAAKQGDEWTIQVNHVEAYRIPEAVISGG